MAINARILEMLLSFVGKAERSKRLICLGYPLNYYNHGFFGFNPTFYHDFYLQSGHRLASQFYGLFGPVLDSQVVTLPAVQGFNSAPERMVVVLVAAQKLNDAEPAWPLQTKYRTNPDLRG